jgi:siroheme synthase-like protein
MLDVSDRPVVIIGGGRVAARKAAGLIAAGATRVTVVSPEFNDQMPTGVRRVSARYRPEHLAGAMLAFAATNVPEVNDAVVSDARERSILVQRVDGDEDRPGDFSTPAVHRDGPLTIAVSTGGSPPLAAEIRDRLAGQIDPIWPRLAEALQQLRPAILRRFAPEDRRAVFRKLASPDGVERFRTRGLDGLKEWVLNVPGKSPGR